MDENSIHSQFLCRCWPGESKHQDISWVQGHWPNSPGISRPRAVYTVQFAMHICWVLCGFIFINVAIYHQPPPTFYVTVWWRLHTGIEAWTTQRTHDAIITSQSLEMTLWRRLDVIMILLLRRVPTGLGDILLTFSKDFFLNENLKISLQCVLCDWLRVRLGTVRHLSVTWTNDDICGVIRPQRVNILQWQMGTISSIVLRNALYFEILNFP